MARRAVTLAGRTSSRYFCGLGVEEFPARHRDDAGRGAFGVEFFAGFHCEADFGAGGDEDQFRRGCFSGFCFGFGQDVGAFVQAFGVGEFFAVDEGDFLP